MKRFKRLIAILPLLLAGCFGSQEGADISAIKATFELPSNAKTLLYQAKPQSIVRENLRILTKFKLSEIEAQRLKEHVKNSPDWQRFPVSSGLLQRMQVDRITQIFDGQLSHPSNHRWYSCRHSGDDILNAKTVVTAATGSKLRDYMFAVIDFDTNTVMVKVRTAY
ncbi:hypothetical protein IQ266_12305 [filamentous cyanobacterium LEGE 11480]|uniref:Uncharacterized protein n=1 Tax=Romeriopsis navalis LEGE 11480 TaxID=2777977 RepID=A0A928Z4M5_9CYAN|nr:hypothetical protein [Romeriopsis navalis]MBE9030513.1 hypothetical protein [Romeriopsis navalis LEGE 11480]